MRTLATLFVLSCLTLGAIAQEPENPETIRIGLEDAWARAIDAHKKKQQAEAEAAKAEWAKAEKEGRKSVRAMRAYSPFPPQDVINKHTKAFQAAAERFSGTPAAVPFHLWVVSQGRWSNNRDAIKHSIETLMKSHSKSTELEPLARGLKELRRKLGQEYCDARLQTLLKTNTEPNTRAFAIFALAEDAFASATSGSREYRLARAELKKATMLTTKAGLRAVIQGKIDLREKLGEGSIAPDITGVDMDGTAFKLSDYKGKIIMLDFWGDW